MTQICQRDNKSDIFLSIKERNQRLCIQTYRISHEITQTSGAIKEEVVQWCMDR